LPAKRAWCASVGIEKGMPVYGFVLAAPKLASFSRWTASPVHMPLTRTFSFFSRKIAIFSTCFQIRLFS